MGLYLIKPISKMTIKEIEKRYNSTEYEYNAGRGDYKDMMVLDLLATEIEKRGYQWSGHELVEK